MAGKITEIRARIKAVQRAIRRAGVDGVLASSPASMFWLAGVSGTSWIIVSGRGAVVMPSRLSDQAVRSELGGGVKVLHPGRGWKSMLDAARRMGILRMGVEDQCMTVANHDALKSALSGDVLLVPAGGMFSGLRAEKWLEERKAILKACAITSKVASWLPALIGPGMSEKDLAARVDSIMRLSGADGPAFDTIALAGSRTAMPHGVPGERRIRKGDLVLVDFGAKVDNYHSDCTRTFSAGNPTAAQRRAYRLVYRAYASARARVRPGVAAEAPWKAANRALGKMSKYFVHGLGHGVGLEIHEAPSLSAGNREILRRGQFVTVEPGIYIPGWGGIRLEDTVMITSHGAKPVTGTLPRELPIVGEILRRKGGQR